MGEEAAGPVVGVTWSTSFVGTLAAGVSGALLVVLAAETVIAMVREALRGGDA